MKRIFAVIFLLLMIVLIYFKADNSVVSYCNDKTETLKNCVIDINNDDFDNCIKRLKDLKDSDRILKYLYFEDVNELNKLINESIFYLKHKKKLEALKTIDESIYIIKTYKDNFSLNSRKFI